MIRAVREIAISSIYRKPSLKLALVKKVELARKFTLNPLSHADILNIPKKELEDAIEAVEWLEDALA